MGPWVGSLSTNKGSSVWGKGTHRYLRVENQLAQTAHCPHKSTVRLRNRKTKSPWAYSLDSPRGVWALAGHVPHRSVFSRGQVCLFGGSSLFPWVPVMVTKSSATFKAAESGGEQVSEWETLQEEEWTHLQRKWSACVCTHCACVCTLCTCVCMCVGHCVHVCALCMCVCCTHVCVVHCVHVCCACVHTCVCACTAQWGWDVRHWTEHVQSAALVTWTVWPPWIPWRLFPQGMFSLWGHSGGYAQEPMEPCVLRLSLKHGACLILPATGERGSGESRDPWLERPTEHKSREMLPVSSLGNTILSSQYIIFSWRNWTGAMIPLQTNDALSYNRDFAVRECGERLQSSSTQIPRSHKKLDTE